MLDGTAYLQGVLAGEALVAFVAGEGSDGKMNPLVSLEIVVPVEALGACVAHVVAILGVVVPRAASVVENLHVPPSNGSALSHGRVVAEHGHLAVGLVEV